MMLGTNFLPIIDATKCTGCGLCVAACPNQVLLMQTSLPVLAKPAACDYSSVCQEVCPTGAVSLSFEIVFNRGATTGRRH